MYFMWVCVTLVALLSSAVCNSTTIQLSCAINNPTKDNIFEINATNLQLACNSAIFSEHTMVSAAINKNHKQQTIKNAKRKQYAVIVIGMKVGEERGINGICRSGFIFYLDER